MINRDLEIRLEPVRLLKFNSILEIRLEQKNQEKMYGQVEIIRQLERSVKLRKIWSKRAKSTSKV